MNNSYSTSFAAESKHNTVKFIKFIGVATILISLITWAIDLLGWSYPCPCCRTERTIIGLLGILLLTRPLLNDWVARYLVLVLGGYGFVVAAMQHFLGWDGIYEGKYVFGNDGPWFFDEMLLSAMAMFILVIQMSVVFYKSARRG